MLHNRTPTGRRPTFAETYAEGDPNYGTGRLLGTSDVPFHYERLNAQMVRIVLVLWSICGGRMDLNIMHHAPLIHHPTT